MINNGAVTWTAHKQSSAILLSTIDAEYMSLSDTSREAIARQHFFDDLRILINTPVLHSDNQAALSIVLNPVQYQPCSKTYRDSTSLHSPSRAKQHDYDRLRFH